MNVEIKGRTQFILVLNRSVTPRRLRSLWGPSCSLPLSSSISTRDISTGFMEQASALDGSSHPTSSLQFTTYLNGEDMQGVGGFTALEQFRVNKDIDYFRRYSRSDNGDNGHNSSASTDHSTLFKLDWDNLKEKKAIEKETYEDTSEYPVELVTVEKMNKEYSITDQFKEIVEIVESKDRFK